jgi:alkanesulfonate monooxygenase
MGSYDRVAAVLLDHIRAGISSLIPAANPHLEEAIRIGEEVLPRVHAAV